MGVSKRWIHFSDFHFISLHTHTYWNIIQFSKRSQSCSLQGHVWTRKDIMLSEQSQRQKEKSCIIYTMNKIVKLTYAESRIVVAGGRGRKMGSCCSAGKMFQFCKIHTFWRCAVYTLSITNDTILLCSHSVMSDSVTPWTIAHQDPLLWDFPGKDTGLGSHFFPRVSSQSRDWT